MNLKQVETFVMVAELGSFTKVAKIMYMTQPAVSFQIKALEEQLGVQLFERGDKNVVLTDAGRLLYPEAKNMLASYRTVIETVEEIKGMNLGTIVVGASTIPGEYLLPKLIGAFKNQYPKVEVVMKIGSSGDVERMLLERSVNIGIVGTLIDRENVDCKKFFTDEMIIIASPLHELAVKGTVQMEELQLATFVMRELGSGTRKTMESFFANYGIEYGELKVAMELGSTRAIISAVQGNLGISVVSKLAASDSIRLGLVKEIKVEGLNMERGLYLAFNTHRYKTSLVAEFEQFLLENTEGV